MITTYHYRLKTSSKAEKRLLDMANCVNIVWNFCKQTQKDALKTKSCRLIKDKKTQKEISIPYFFSSSEMDKLVAGSSKELGLHSQSVQSVSQEYVQKKIRHKSLLRWRGKKSLPWVPFKASGIKFHGDSVVYAGFKFRLWNSYLNPKGANNKSKYSTFDKRGLPADAVITNGSFVRDKRGHWYLNLTFKSDLLAIEKESHEEIGIDIGITTLASCSNGEKIKRPNLRKAALVKLIRLKKCQHFAQRQQAKSKKYTPLPKLKQERNLHAKITNKRKDYLHKESTKLVKKCSLIAVGDVPCKLMNRSKSLSGISLDSGIGMFKEMLKYKSIRDASTYKEISERNSTRTCSKCTTKGPRIKLGVRSWVCEVCHYRHDRDINAAQNILSMYKIQFPQRACCADLNKSKS